MARKKLKPKVGAFLSFNVTYEDGSVTSNRRIPRELLDQSFGDALLELARVAILQQDEEIAERSGRKRGKIQAIVEA